MQRWKERAPRGSQPLFTDVSAGEGGEGRGKGLCGGREMTVCICRVVALYAG